MQYINAVKRICQIQIAALKINREKLKIERNVEYQMGKL